jgi:hypothetical protein
MQDERVFGRQQAAEAEHEDGTESPECGFTETGPRVECQPVQLRIFFKYLFFFYIRLL